MNRESLEGPKYALEYLAKKQAMELTQSTTGLGVGLGVGVDIELIEDINVENETFVERNFTLAEQLYCRSRPNPHASFAGKWCAKEAVVKAVSSLNPTWEKVWIKGSAAPLIDIEISIGTSGAPVVLLHGEVKEAAEKAGVSEVKVSISHIDTFAIATAITR
ncbi:beta subunit of fatty acid synthetase [Coemansia sp. RSA 485]|nr:beta subunit of fatty acid synthetase [Coemansia sp. RSA 485]